MTAASAKTFSRVRLSTRFAVLMAILALFGMLGLATWHDIMPHVHDSGSVVMIDDDHHQPAPDHVPDAADLMHLAAHAVTQTFDLPSSPLLTAAVAPVALAWTLGSTPLVRSPTPLSILRPPKG